MLGSLTNDSLSTFNGGRISGSIPSLDPTERKEITKGYIVLAAKTILIVTPTLVYNNSGQRRHREERSFGPLNWTGSDPWLLLLTTFGFFLDNGVVAICVKVQISQPGK